MNHANQQIHGGRPASMFQIAFKSPDRHKAKAVVDQLVSKFTERSVKVSTTQSNLTTDFLSSELRNAKGELDRLATRWRHFARPIPGGFPSRFRTTSRL